MTPVLPEAEIRAAVAAEDWPYALALLAEHERELLTVLAQTAGRIEAAAPWRALLGAQRTLLAELERARSAAGEQLRQLGSDRRGLRAYRRETLQ